MLLNTKKKIYRKSTMRLGFLLLGLLKTSNAEENSQVQESEYEVSPTKEHEDHVDHSEFKE